MTRKDALWSVFGLYLSGYGIVGVATLEDLCAGIEQTAYFVGASFAGARLIQRTVTAI